MRLLYNFLKDMKLSSKSFYFYVELAMALIMVFVLLFVVPENFDGQQKFYVHMDIEGAVADKVEEALEGSEDEYILLDSREAVEEALEKERTSAGVSISMDSKKVVYDFILQGYEDEKFKNIIETVVKSEFASQVPDYKRVTEVRILDEDAEKLSDRLNMLPIILTLNAAFMGLFIIASYIFLDKDEGTIKALAVTPGHIWEYLLGKVGVIMVTGLASGFIVLIPIAGTKAHYIHFTVLLIITNLFGSALGLFIASFFDTMAKAMGWLYGSIITLGFAAMSYYMPAFSPLIIRILPSYPMLFAYREILLDKPNLGFVYMNVGLFAGLAVILFLLANNRYKKNLTV